VLRRGRGVGLLRVLAGVADFAGVTLWLASLLVDELERCRTMRDGDRFLEERRGVGCRRTWPSSNPIC